MLTSSSIMAASEVACVRSGAVALMPAAQMTSFADTAGARTCKARSTSCSALKISRRLVGDVSLSRSCQQQDGL